MPTTLRVISTSVGAFHQVNAIRAEQTTTLELKLQSALIGSTVGPKLEKMDADEYGDNRAEMLDSIRARGVGLKVPEGGWKNNEDLDSLAATMGIEQPDPGPWLHMLCELAEKLPQAMLI
eukprot:82987-Prymnesium_polylepis.1